MREKPQKQPEIIREKPQKQPDKKEREPEDSGTSKLASDLIRATLPQQKSRETGALALFRKTAPTVAFAIALYVLLTNLGDAAGAVTAFSAALFPVIIGAVLAFVLNIPLTFLEEKVLRRVRREGLRNALGITLTYLLFLSLVLTVGLIVIPRAGKIITAVIGGLPAFGKTVYGMAAELVAKWGLDEELLSYLQIDWNKVTKDLLSWTGNTLPRLLDTTKGITSTVFQYFIGCILSVYMLAVRKRLSVQSKRLCRAVFRPTWAQRLIDFFRLSYVAFRGYTAGILLEAVILGALCTVGMVIFRFPQPLLTGLLMSVGALVPMFGAVVSTLACSLIMALQTDITVGLLGLLTLTILQQLEGNLIYPRVMGSRLRLPGLWVLTAATVGGALMGITGLILSVPVMSILYSLLKALVQLREAAAKERKAEENA